jgi:hypothetical protein
MDVVDECLGTGKQKRYGDDEEETESAKSWLEHEDRPHEPKMPDGEDESEEGTAEALARGWKPRMGDCRRHARDRRMATDQGLDWLAELTARIGSDTSFR